MDIKYWNQYYEKKLPPEHPSPFAQDTLPFLKTGKRLLELGCGNGRDILYFLKNGLEVAGIDQSDTAISQLKENCHDPNAHFIQDNFITSKILQADSFDYIYSRFTVHSISDQDELLLWKNLYYSLKDEGLLFIEVRSVKDEIYGLGERVAPNAYIYQGHYRRFIILEEMIENLKKENFTILFSDEQRNWAAYKRENPIVIRIRAKKSFK